MAEPDQGASLKIWSSRVKSRSGGTLKSLENSQFFNLFNVLGSVPMLFPTSRPVSRSISVAGNSMPSPAIRHSQSFTLRLVRFFMLS